MLDSLCECSRLARHATIFPRIARVFAAYLGMGAFGSGDADESWLFEFDIETVMWAKYQPRPSWPPAYRTWKAE